MTSETSTLPRLAYLVNEYPKPSHTFIRRELLHVEALGYQIHRVSIRPPGQLVDAGDLSEAEQTHVVLAQPKLRLMADAAVTALQRPGKFWRALRQTLQRSRVSDRGVVRFLAYLVEAGHLVRWFRREGVDHVHVHFGTNGVDVARLVHCLGGPTYSMMIHGPAEFDQPIGSSLGDKVHDSLFTTVITYYCMSQVRRWIPYADWEKVHIVHCPVSEKFLAPAEPIAHDSTTFVCIGRLTPQKGHKIAIDALAKLKAKGLPGRLVFAGDGEMRGVIEQRVQDLHLEDCVEITGWVDEARVRELLTQSRALVLPSFAEGLPVVIMEALAMERPVITTAIAGIPELVKHGESGWLVVPSDEDSLAASMEACLTTPVDRLREMGKMGREAVRAEHYAPTEAAKLDRLIRRYAMGRG